MASKSAFRSTFSQKHSASDVLAPTYWEQSVGVDEPPLTPTIRVLTTGAYQQKRPPDIRGAGHAVRSLEAALWAFARTETFTDCVLAAVNLGDDADSTGAVAGQLAGAWYGTTGMPSAWLTKLAWRAEIDHLARALWGQWPYERVVDSDASN